MVIATLLVSGRQSYPGLASELVSEVALCTRFAESKAYLTACLKVLLALPLTDQDPAAIKQLRALVGEGELKHNELHQNNAAIKQIKAPAQAVWLTRKQTMLDSTLIGVVSVWCSSHEEKHFACPIGLVI